MHNAGPRPPAPPAVIRWDIACVEDALATGKCRSDRDAAAYLDGLRAELVVSQAYVDAHKPAPKPAEETS